MIFRTQPFISSLMVSLSSLQQVSLLFPLSVFHCQFISFFVLFVLLNELVTKIFTCRCRMMSTDECWRLPQELLRTNFSCFALLFEENQNSSQGFCPGQVNNDNLFCFQSTPQF